MRVILREVSVVNNTMYEGTQESLAYYFQAFCDSAKRRSLDDSYNSWDRKMARREAYCWGEAARIVRSTKILPPADLVKIPQRPKTIVPAPKEALKDHDYLRAS